MAWIESHQELRHHPKLFKLRQTLSAEWPTISAVHLTGHLHWLWWWCMDYAMDGDLSKFSSLQIAEAAGWNDKAEPFINGLIEAGFIDKIDSVTLKVHDWLEFCGELVLKRLDRRQAKRGKTADNIRRTADNIRRNPPKSAEMPPTVPNRTVPNRTVPKTGFEKPTHLLVTEYAKTISFDLDGQIFMDYYEANGWKVGRNPMKDWRAAVRTWKSRRTQDGQQKTHANSNHQIGEVERPDSKFSEVVRIVKV